MPGLRFPRRSAPRSIGSSARHPGLDPIERGDLINRGVTAIGGVPRRRAPPTPSAGVDHDGAAHRALPAPRWAGASRRRQTGGAGQRHRSGHRGLHKRFDYSVARLHRTRRRGGVPLEASIIPTTPPLTERRHQRRAWCSPSRPMLTLGGIEWEQWDDGWTVVTKDRSRTAQFEHARGDRGRRRGRSPCAGGGYRLPSISQDDRAPSRCLTIR